MQNPEFGPEEKIDILLNNMYLDDPPDLQEAVEKALWFLRCGEERHQERNQPALCDFAQDGRYIYNAFLKADIDLDSFDDGEMHWWTFMSRFAELPESFFSRIVYLRSRRKPTKEEKAEIARIGSDVIDLKGSTPSRDYEFEQMI